MGPLPAAPLIRSDAHITEYYSTDASGRARRPAGAAMPRDTREVADVVRRAVRDRMGLIPRGAGTGLAGGAVGGGIILDTSRMDHVAYEGGVVRAGPGARLGAVNALLHGRGRILGPDPSVGPYCSIGGMVATNASGSLSLGYGSTMDNLESVVMVDGRGDVVRLPGDKKLGAAIHRICRRAKQFPRTSKNSCGYRLDAVTGPETAHRAVAASEGTLGVITEVRLRTYEAPRRAHAISLEYADGRAAAADCSGLVGCGPVALEVTGPGMMEGYGDSCVLIAEFHDNAGDDAGWPDYIRDMVRAAAPGCRTMRDIDGTWRARRGGALARSLRAAGGGFASIIEDATVPLHKLPDLFDLIYQLGERTGSEPAYYGHAGSGNIHVRTPADHMTEEWYLEEVIGMGGTITGEHGDGSGRAGMVLRQYGRDNYELFGRLKDLFDPYGVMNPGKVLGTPWG